MARADVLDSLNVERMLRRTDGGASIVDAFLLGTKLPALLPSSTLGKEVVGATVVLEEMLGHGVRLRLPQRERERSFSHVHLETTSLSGNVESAAL